MAKNENTEAAAPSRLGVWFQHHVHSVVFSLGRACRKPWATLLTVMVMALALALPLACRSRWTTSSSSPAACSSRATSTSS